MGNCIIFNPFNCNVLDYVGWTLTSEAGRIYEIRQRMVGGFDILDGITPLAEGLSNVQCSARLNELGIVSAVAPEGKASPVDWPTWPPPGMTALRFKTFPLNGGETIKNHLVNSADLEWEIGAWTALYTSFGGRAPELLDVAE